MNRCLLPLLRFDMAELWAIEFSFCRWHKILCKLCGNFLGDTFGSNVSDVAYCREETAQPAAKHWMPGSVFAARWAQYRPDSPTSCQPLIDLRTALSSTVWASKQFHLLFPLIALSCCCRADTSCSLPGRWSWVPQTESPAWQGRSKDSGWSQPEARVEDRTGQRTWLLCAGEASYDERAIVRDLQIFLSFWHLRFLIHQFPLVLPSSLPCVDSSQC